MAELILTDQEELLLTNQEKEALILLLEGNLSDLSVEIADTDRKNFRDQLKARRDVLQKILDTLRKGKS
jgi:hypothetical protein